MTETAAPSTPTPANNKKTFSILGLIVVIILVFVGYRLLTGGTTKTSTAIVSGTINFNGLKPAENPNQAASIKLMQRAKGQADFSDTGVSVPVADQAEWRWENAATGTTYELKANGYIGDQLLKSTNTIITTAPASDQVLTFNITTVDLPENLRPTPPAAPEPVSVNGTLVINGFIPAGATVTIYGRPTGTTADYQAAVENIPAKNGANWTYNNATAGETYDYQAELYTSTGDFIGQSTYLTVTAPAANEIVTINSSAAAPSQTAAISGTVKLQGPVDQNSTILLLQRKAGEAEYTPVNRYPAANNTAWSWDGAVSGTTYDITAALQVNEQNTATGEVVTVSAPAEAVVITIDTGVNLAAPTQTVSVNCGPPDGTNHHNASVSIPQYEGAQLYYLEVGTSAGANNTYADTVKPNQSATVFVAASSPYFARYSYTACTDCNVKDKGNWAGWSPTLGFQCP